MKKKSIIYGILIIAVSLLQTACGDDTLVTGITLSQQDMNLRVGESETLIATVYPSDADNPAVTWTSSNVSVASVDQTGKVTAVAGGTSTITCLATDGSGVYAECKVTVDAHEWVDLGLPSRTLWATCNVGANTPWGYGDYYAWGETEPKEEYTWSTYKYCMGTFNTMTKYCQNSNWGYNGYTDNLTELLPEDDAATANWGDNWQMPSRTQFQELINESYTTAEWTQLNGVNGALITSKNNGNSIFLPAASGRIGCYWSRSRNTVKGYNENRACDLFFEKIPSPIDIGCDEGSKLYEGQSVRPVRKQ